MDAVPLDWLRAVYDDWGRGDFRAGGDRLAPQFRFSTTADFPDPVFGVPNTGLRDYWRGFLGSWSRLRIEAEELVANGSRVLARVRQRGELRSTRIPTDISYWQVWWFRGGVVTRFQAFAAEVDARTATNR